MSLTPEQLFAKKIQKGREVANLTQHMFAEALGVSRGLVALYERGDRAMPRATRVLQIAQFFGVDPEMLISDQISLDHFESDMRRQKYDQDGHPIPPPYIAFMDHMLEQTDYRGGTTFETTVAESSEGPEVKGSPTDDGKRPESRRAAIRRQFRMSRDMLELIGSDRGQHREALFSAPQSARVQVQGQAVGASVGGVTATGTRRLLAGTRALLGEENSDGTFGRLGRPGSGGIVSLSMNFWSSVQFMATVQHPELNDGFEVMGRPTQAGTPSFRADFFKNGLFCEFRHVVPSATDSVLGMSSLINVLGRVLLHARFFKGVERMTLMLFDPSKAMMANTALIPAPPFADPRDAHALFEESLKRVPVKKRIQELINIASEVGVEVLLVGDPSEAAQAISDRLPKA